jgi:hypothetical protein
MQLLLFDLICKSAAQHSSLHSSVVESRTFSVVHALYEPLAGLHFTKNPIDAFPAMH